MMRGRIKGFCHGITTIHHSGWYSYTMAGSDTTVVQGVNAPDKQYL